MKKKCKNARLKWTKERVFDEMCQKELFGKDLNTVVCAIAKKNASNVLKVTGLLKQLLQEKRLTENENGGLENTSKICVGKVFIKPGENFAHVEVEGRKSDIYVYDRKDAMDGDTVEIAVRELFGKLEGVIIRIKERKNEFLIGTIREEEKGLFSFVPSNDKFDKEVVLVGDNLKSMANKKAKVKIIYADTRFTKNKKNAIIGTVEEVYGYAGDPIVENIAIAEEFGFTQDFSQEVLDYVEKIPEEIRPVDRENTVDLTDVRFCTIDPQTCKDIDDAIYVERSENGFKALVALAHVSYYVPRGSEIDSDAFSRAISCYLGDGVYPMLHEKLSNGICSLNPNVDRRTICAEIDVDRQGNIVDYKFMYAIINSKYKLSYEDAEKIRFDEDFAKNYSDIKESIDSAYELSDILVDYRKKRGALTLNCAEPTFIFNGHRTKVEDMVDKTKITSTKIIESLMILFNEAVGDFVKESGLSTLFRVHSKPDAQKVHILKAFCEEFGINYDGDMSSKGINRLLEDIKGRPEEEFLHSLVLRCLPKAKYQPNNIGHYALASKNYIHSTAAIRRYSDIITQRFLDESINKNKIEENYSELEAQGKYLTQREICADKAERESRKLLNVIWAEGQINRVFEGYISDIVSSGVFVKIKEKKASIFIPIEKLVNGNIKHYQINDKKTEIKRKNSSEKYRIGDVIKVLITEADRNTRKVYGEKIIAKQCESEKKSADSCSVSLNESSKSCSQFLQKK